MHSPRLNHPCALGHANNANPAISILTMATLCTCPVILTKPQMRGTCFYCQNALQKHTNSTLTCSVESSHTLLMRRNICSNVYRLFGILSVYTFPLARKTSISFKPSPRSCLHLMNIASNKPRSSVRVRKPLQLRESGKG